MNFNKKLATAVSGAVLLMAGQFALADSTTDIVDALVSKGVLTEEEGKLISKGHETKKKAEGTVTFKDGFKMNSGDGKSNMSINGRIQLDYRKFDTPVSSTVNAKAADTYDIRRAYIGAGGTFKKYYDWKVVANFAEDKTSLSLDEAFVNLHYWDQVQFQFGQFKMPMSLEERTSSRFTNFTERSYVNNPMFTAAKDQGAMIHGTIVPGLNYAAAVSGGGTQNADEVDAKRDNVEWILHANADFADLLNVNPKEMIIHVGGSYAEQGISGTQAGATQTQRTLGRGIDFFGTTTGIVHGDTIDRTRYGVEGVLSYGPFKAQGEYAHVNWEGVIAATAATFDQSAKAWYGDVQWLVSGETYKDSYKKGKFDRLTPKKDFDPTTFSGGLWEVSAGYSKFDASDITTTSSGFKIGSGNLTNVADTWRVGVKFIPEANTRILLNFVKTDFDRAVSTAGISSGNATSGINVTSEKAINMRVQYDF